MRKYSDHEIIKGIREGGIHEEKCENFLYKKHRDNFVKHKKSNTNLDKSERNTCYNDAFLLLKKMIKSGDFKEGYPIKPLFEKIYSRKCIDLFRKNTNYKSRTSQGTIEIPVGLTDKAISTLDRIIQDDLLDKVHLEIERFRPSCKNMLELYLKGYSHKEIVALNPSINSVGSAKTTLSRCIKRLIDKIKPKK